MEQVTLMGEELYTGLYDDENSDCPNDPRGLPLPNQLTIYPFLYPFLPAKYGE